MLFVRSRAIIYSLIRANRYDILVNRSVNIINHVKNISLLNCRLKFSAPKGSPEKENDNSKRTREDSNTSDDDTR